MVMQLAQPLVCGISKMAYLAAAIFRCICNTAYSIELNAASDIPEWKKSIRIMLEEDGYFDEKGFRYINERQKEIYMIPRKMNNLGK